MMTGVRRLACAALLCALSAGCATTEARRPAPPPPNGRVLAGIDVLEAEGFRRLRGRRVGLITNHTGRDARGRSTAEVLAEASSMTLVAVFSPEHGLAGAVEDGSVSSSTLRLGGRDVPVHSLYSGGLAGMRPKPEQLEGIDTLVFDIQDVGARFYTYLATMGMALEEAAKAHVRFVVLDRPNPIDGITVEGPLLTDPELPKLSPTSFFPVPVRHGLTAGEMALLHNAKVRHPGLQVVRMRGWDRRMWYDQTGLPWTPPSPNLPYLAAAALYPGIGLFEASNLSVGRGTPYPFGWVGAPWLDSERVVELLQAALLDGVEFSAEDATPSKSVYAGELCRGVRITVTDRRRLRPLAVFRHINEALRETHRNDFIWRWDEARRMLGSEEFQRIYQRDGDPVKILLLFNRDAEEFERTRKPYLLY
ncbi:MAG: DUF1343 domain-containing protein [Elusimicrobia bacterium]|nr:DUF1343 domain-containing protein [Elusimicrobiota bacterium]